jgi:DNA-binding response OmpR family regulator
MVMSLPDSLPANAGSSHLLVVDDDSAIGEMLTRYFSGQGFFVSTARDGSTLRATLGCKPVDLILLDLGLPGEDGLQLMRELQQHWHGPVLIVSGRRESVERILGLEMGADDYITKPFDLRELLARVRSALRRSKRTPSRKESTCRFEGYLFDRAKRCLLSPANEEIRLTTGEFELLCALVEMPNQPLSRDQLMARVHGRDAGPFDRAIDVQIGRLRRKIEPDPANPRLIKSVRGVGYLLAAQVH